MTTWDAAQVAKGHTYRTVPDAPYGYCLTCGCARHLHDGEKNASGLVTLDELAASEEVR